MNGGLGAPPAHAGAGAAGSTRAGGDRGRRGGARSRPPLPPRGLLPARRRRCPRRRPSAPPARVRSVAPGVGPAASGRRRRRLGRAHPRRPPERGRASRSRRRARSCASASSPPVEAGQRLLGVWGADPGPGEGAPGASAPDRRRAGAARRQDLLLGCRRRRRGAGDGRQRRRRRSRRWSCVDCGGEVEVDRSWYRAAGLRASESHRVVFHDAPVTAVLGEPGSWPANPGSRATRCARRRPGPGWSTRPSTAALDELAGAAPTTPLAQLAAGRHRGGPGTVDAWLERGGADGAADRRGLRGRATADRDRDAGRDRPGRESDPGERRGGLRLPSLRHRRPARPCPTRPRDVPAPASSRSAPRPTRRRRAGAPVSARPPTDRAPVEHFERLARESADPWDYATSEYEQAQVPAHARLPARAHRPHARARLLGRRLHRHAGAPLRRAWSPSTSARPRWPGRASGSASGRDHGRAAPADACRRRCRTAPSSTIVCAEVLYYWSPSLVADGLRRIEAALAPGGTLLAVHWRTRRPAPRADRRRRPRDPRRTRLARPRGEPHGGDYLLDRWCRR